MAGADALGCSCFGNAVNVGRHCLDLGRERALLQFLFLQNRDHILESKSQMHATLCDTDWRAFVAVHPYETATVASRCVHCNPATSRGGLHSVHNDMHA